MDNEQIVDTVAEPTTEPTQETKPVVDNQEVERRAEELYQARNFKMLRQQAEQIAKERDEYKRQLESLHPQQQDDYDIRDDDFVEPKHIKKQKQYVDKQVQELKKQHEILQQALIEQRIRSSCPDFDKVCTEQNLIKLRNEYPEIAETLNSSTDMQSKAIAAYKLIKKLDIHNPQNDADRALIAKNTAKPKPSNAITNNESGLTRVDAFQKGMTDKEKEEQYKRALEYARMAQ